jgi:D-alanyl-D-alanine endopeptidase (penicillin-binding protein 7)
VASCSIRHERGAVQQEPGAGAAIASLTKLMTALVVTERKQPSGRSGHGHAEDIRYREGAAARGFPSAPAARQEMLHLALMSSENRAPTPRPPLPGRARAFVAAMNRKARELGHERHALCRADWLSSRNQSSARDPRDLVKAEHEHQIIRELSTSTSSGGSRQTRPMQFRNTQWPVRSPHGKSDCRRRLHLGSGPLPRHAGEACRRKVIMVFWIPRASTRDRRCERSARLGDADGPLASALRARSDAGRRARLAVPKLTS